jgi:uncharacterized membrane protein required for colicin V production
MMQSLYAQIANVHGRALSDSFQPLKYLDVQRRITAIALFLIFVHVVSKINAKIAQLNDFLCITGIIQAAGMQDFRALPGMAWHKGNSRAIWHCN